MSRIREFNFKKARRVTPEEVEMFRRAIEEKLGVKRPPRGRPPKEDEEKFKPISIRLHPKVLEWAMREAKRRSIGYQTVINEELLKKVSA